MPFIQNRPCKSPGCSALVAAGAGSYCPAHTRTAPSRVDRAARDRLRGSAAARGYDHRWQQARAAFLSRYPLCPGVLIATEHWTRALAQEFHALREQAREQGTLLIFPSTSPRALRGDEPRRLVAPKPGEGGSPQGEGGCAIAIFLEQFPIYRIEPTDVGRPAVIVDHIIPHKGDITLLWGEWNWQPITKRAHDKKTAREAKQRATEVRP